MKTMMMVAMVAALSACSQTGGGDYYLTSQPPPADTPFQRGYYRQPEPVYQPAVRGCQVYGYGTKVHCW